MKGGEDIKRVWENPFSDSCPKGKNERWWGIKRDLGLLIKWLTYENFNARKRSKKVVAKTRLGLNKGGCIKKWCGGKRG